MIKDALIKARKKRGWTQQNLADETGIKQPAIARYESGTKPSPKNMKILIEKLQVSPEYFAEKSNGENSESEQFDQVDFDTKVKQIKRLSLKNKILVKAVLDRVLDFQVMEDSFNRIR